MNANIRDVEFVVDTIAQTVVENERYFSDLDSVAGDGDFGYSMARGFEKVLADWDSIDRSDVGAFLRRVAVTLTSRIGGTSGPLWGTAFLRAGGVARGASDLAGSDVVAMLRAAIDGIKERGHADVGDKTLLDALVPLADTLASHVEAGSDSVTTLDAMAVIARQSADATSSMQARRGRASYTGERSIGSPDAGAVAIAVLMEQVSAALQARA